MSLPNIDHDMSNLSLDFNDSSMRQSATNDPTLELMRLIEHIADIDLRDVILQRTQQALRRHQQQIVALEKLNRDTNAAMADQQIKYEKAVREMQFFKKKYEKLSEANKLKAQRRRSYSTDSGSTYDPRPSIATDPQPPLPVQHRQASQKNIPLHLDNTMRNTVEDSVHDPHAELKRRVDTVTPMSPRSPPPSETSVYPSHSPASPTTPHRQRQRQPSLVSQVLSLDGTMTSTTTSSGSYEPYSPYNSALFSIEEPSEPAPAPSQQNIALSSNTPVVPPRRKKLSQSSNPPSILNAGNSVPSSPEYHQKRLEALSFGGSEGFWDTISQNPPDGAVERLIRYVIVSFLFLSCLTSSRELA